MRFALPRPGVASILPFSGPMTGLSSATRFISQPSTVMWWSRAGNSDVEQTIDLNRISNQNGQVLGWCRGVLPLNERRLWVGFTRVRPTKFVENVAWIKHGGTHLHKPSHLALYNLEQGRCEQEIDLEPHGIGVVFSVLPVPSVDEE